MNKIKKFLGKIARRILRQELQDLNNEIQTLKEQADRDKYCKTNILLPKSVMSELIRILPSANSVTEDLFANLKRMNLKSKSLSLVNVSVIDETFGVLRLTMQINSCGLEFDIYRRQKTLSYTMFGIDTELTIGHWTVDGIKVVSDEDFELIFTAINAQKNAVLELKNEGYL